MATWGTPVSLRGSKGDAGLSFLTGHGAPASSLGVDTQGYLDVDAFDLYLRSNGTWSKTGNIKGAMGISALNAQLLHGQGAPTTSTFGNNVDAIYIDDTSGEVWYFDFDGAKQWVDSGTTFRGAPGAPGAAGDRGTYTYTGSGAPSSDLTTFSPGPARKGDLYYDLSTMGGPYLYVLGN